VTPTIRRLVAAGALTALLVLSVGLPAGAATSPKSWASSVCGALDTWVTRVQNASAKTAEATPTSATDVKKRLTKLLATAQAATKQASSKLKSAGQPSVKGGQQIAALVREGFAQAQRTITQAKKSLASAKTTDPEGFTTAARTAQDGLEAGLEAIQAAFSAARTTDAPPLVKAFAADDDCQAVSA
jgi:hypothetical protein